MIVIGIHKMMYKLLLELIELDNKKKYKFIDLLLKKLMNQKCLKELLKN